jgi:hypothetical protein
MTALRPRSGPCGTSWSDPPIFPPGIFPFFQKKYAPPPNGGFIVLMILIEFA